MGPLRTTLIGFDHGRTHAKIAASLAKHGHAVTVVPGCDWLARHNDLVTDAIVLLLDGVPPNADILAALAASKAPVLAVVPDEILPSDRDTLACRCAVVTGRCDADALDARLRRLIDRAVPPAEPGEDAVAVALSRLNFVGRSPAFQQALEIIKKISKCTAPVLIEGETGTGKELAARAIHYLGARKAFPFIPINCGAIPDTLIESELFGHHKGAFTGAHETYPGVVEQAHGGTLFLDEVDALSEKAQIALLRFLQDQEYKPLGAKQVCKADIRTIAATNADLATLVEQGRFRKDLMYRLYVMSISMPPLRERSGDVDLLARYFLSKFVTKYGQAGKRFHPRLLEWMNRYPWPGNVRELENFMHRESLLAEEETLYGRAIDEPRTERRGNVADRRRPVAFDGGLNAAKERLLAEFEKRYLCWLMNETHGNVTHAARRAGKERRALGKLLRKHGLASRDFARRVDDGRAAPVPDGQS